MSRSHWAPPPILTSPPSVATKSPRRFWRSFRAIVDTNSGSLRNQTWLFAISNCCNESHGRTSFRSYDHDHAGHRARADSRASRPAARPPDRGCSRSWRNGNASRNQLLPGDSRESPTPRKIWNHRLKPPRTPGPTTSLRILYSSSPARPLFFCRSLNSTSRISRATTASAIRIVLSCRPPMANAFPVRNSAREKYKMTRATRRDSSSFLPSGQYSSFDEQLNLF